MKSAEAAPEAERVVVDTSVLVSAAFGGNPLAALERARSCTVLVSDEIVNELLEVLGRLRPKLGAVVHDRLAQLAAQVLQTAERVVVKKRLSLCRDPNDNIFLETCLAGRATILLTGDGDLLSLTRQDLKPAGLARLRILNPSAWLAQRK